MTPEQRADRALLDTPYRTPKTRIVREIREALCDQRLEFRESLSALDARLHELEALAAPTTPDLHSACQLLRLELLDAFRRFHD